MVAKCGVSLHFQGTSTAMGGGPHSEPLSGFPWVFDKEEKESCDVGSQKSVMVGPGVTVARQGPPAIDPAQFEPTLPRSAAGTDVGTCCQTFASNLRRIYKLYARLVRASAAPPGWRWGDGHGNRHGWNRYYRRNLCFELCLRVPWLRDLRSTSTQHIGSDRPLEPRGWCPPDAYDWRRWLCTRLL